MWSEMWILPATFNRCCCLAACRHWRKLGWWIAALYSIGSILFVIR